MKSAGRRTLKILAEARGSPSAQHFRTFACSTGTSKQARNAGQGKPSNHSASLGQDTKSTAKVGRIPITWTTAATSLSDEARAFVSGSENESLSSFEIVPDEQDSPPQSILARSQVRKGVIVECRRYVIPLHFITLISSNEIPILTVPIMLSSVSSWPPQSRLIVYDTWSWNQLARLSHVLKKTFNSSFAAVPRGLDHRLKAKSGKLTQPMRSTCQYPRKYYSMLLH
jgi:hypothetical protein